MKERKEERERGAEQEPEGKKLRKEQQDYFHSHLLKCKKTQCCYSSSSQLHKTVSERSCQTMFHTKCSALLSHWAAAQFSELQTVVLWRKSVISMHKELDQEEEKHRQQPLLMCFSSGPFEGPKWTVYPWKTFRHSSTFTQNTHL